MKLYYMPGACSLADHITLEWIGQPFETQKMSHDEIKQDWYLKLNPAGAVPVLEDNGWILTQNAAILNYLTDRFPEAGLGGDGSAQGRAEVNRWLGMLNADMHPQFWALFGATAYLGDDAVIDETKEHARQALRGQFERLDARLENRDWLADQRSIADPYLFVLLRWARAMKVNLDGLHNLDAFFRRMHGDDAVQRVMKEEGLA